MKLKILQLFHLSNFEFARVWGQEGEDDSLESWREGHIRFFRNEGKELGYEFKEDMLVVFEDFEVVYKE